MGKSKRNTLQKEVVKEIALSSCDHPGAERIYAKAKAIIPNISLATVYRILNELVDDGMLREVSIPGAPSRFDKTTEVHAHFICLKCGEVEDISVCADNIIASAKQCSKNEIDNADIVFKGVCRRCLEEKL